MKIGVISDTHIPDRAKDIPAQILEAFRDADMIIHAGDLIDLTVLDKLKKICKNVKAVWGNMDSDETRRALPEKTVIKINDFKIGVMHGYGNPTNLVELMTSAFKQDNVNLIIFGHSHVSFNLKIGKVIYFNPGSPTDTMFSPYNSFGIIEINDKIKTKICKL